MEFCSSYIWITGWVKTFLKSPDQNCSPPTNWTRKGSTFYYSMTNLTYSFEEALTVCRSHGAQLPKMTNKKELNDVISQMSMTFSTHFKTNLNYFISSLTILIKITNNELNFGISNVIWHDIVCTINYHKYISYLFIFCLVTIISSHFIWQSKLVSFRVEVRGQSWQARHVLLLRWGQDEPGWRYHQLPKHGRVSIRGWQSEWNQLC